MNVLFIVFGFILLGVSVTSGEDKIIDPVWVNLRNHENESVVPASPDEPESVTEFTTVIPEQNDTGEEIFPKCSDQVRSRSGGKKTIKPDNVMSMNYRRMPINSNLNEHIYFSVREGRFERWGPGSN